VHVHVHVADAHMHGAAVRVYGADVHMHGAAVRVYGADVRLHGADAHVYGADVSARCRCARAPRGVGAITDSSYTRAFVHSDRNSLTQRHDNIT